MAGNTLGNRALAEAFAGAGGGILSMVLCYPLMNLSTRQQVQKQPRTEVSSGSGERATTGAAADGRPATSPAAVVSSTTTYGGVVDSLIQIFQEEGVAGLYKGLNSALFGTAVTQFVYYWAYSAAKVSAQRVVSGESLLAVLSGAPSQSARLSELSVAGNMGVGFVAGALTAVVTNPIWTVNTRMMTSAKKGENTGGFLSVLGEVWQAEGVAGLMRGIGPALILVINPTIQYMVYSKCREYWLAAKKARGSKSPGTSGLEVFVLGAIAKIAATLVTYPYILVKSNLQAGKTDAAGGRRTSANDVIQRILREEGPSGFYKGLRSKILQSVLMASFLFLFQDKLLRYTITLVNLLRPVRR